MAGELLQYSGLVAKVKAMHGRLLKQQDFEKIMEFQTVSETIAFLQEQDGYGKIYSGHEEIQHRGQVEELIHNSIQEDYQRLCKFCNPQQKKAMELYRQQLLYGNSVPEVDINYFVEVWKQIGKFQNRQVKRILKEIFGTQIDWLNIMWIYRAKRFFRQPPEEIYAMLIPIQYKLKKVEFQQMLDTRQADEFIGLLGNTAYFKGKEALVNMKDEVSYHQTIKKMYRNICKKYPMSMAPVFFYLYNKEQEIEHLTTAMEGIRYQLPVKDIRELILSTM